MVLTPDGKPVEMELDPSETTCPVCVEPATLVYASKFRKRALLVCVEAVQYITVRVKICPTCGLKVSYKDHDKHVFNYNDSLVI